MPGHRIVPANSDGPQPQVEVPVIELANVKLVVGRAPLDPQINAFFIGPVVLQVSFDDVSKRQLVRALTGIELPNGVGDVQA